jgi:hypothetical protein
MKIVHLARDEKFIPLMCSLFEEARPGANRFVIAQRQRGRQRFVQASDKVGFRQEWHFRTPLIARDVADADCIVVHSMTTIFANALRYARPDARVVWIGWGYDYYPLLEELLGDPLLPATRELLKTPRDGRSFGVWRTGFAALFGRPSRPVARRTALASVASRLDVCAVIPTELPLLHKVLPALRAQAIEIPLFTTEDVFERGPQVMDGPDILIGNSATASNNHLEAFELLRDRLTTGRLVVPLSYGDTGYGQRVAAIGRDRFGERLDALTQWMPLDAYNDRVRRCGFVVMNHRRQQAVGNIGAALYKGATLYLRTENPLFAFYRGLGIHLRSVDELALPSAKLQPIDASQRAENRALIGAYYRRARVVVAMRHATQLDG